MEKVYDATVSPTSKANEWIKSFRPYYDCGENMVWLNLILERQFGLISDNLWRIVCRFLHDPKSNLDERSPLERLEAVFHLLPMTPFLGPHAVEDHDLEQDKIELVTLIPAKGFEGMFEVEENVIKQINTLAKSISAALLSNGDPSPSQQELHRLIDGLKASLPQNSSGASEERNPSQKQRVRTRHETHANQVPNLLQLFSNPVGPLTETKAQGNSDIPLRVRWVAPEKVLRNALNTENLTWDDPQAMKRVIQLLGLKPFADSADKSNPDCRFLVHFTVEAKYRELIRKPTMLSGGFPRIYATFHDHGKGDHDKIRGFGRTVDLQTHDIGIHEAIVPEALVAAMAHNIRIIGLVLPSEITDLMSRINHPDFVHEVSKNRLMHLKCYDKTKLDAFETEQTKAENSLYLCLGKESLKCLSK